MISRSRDFAASLMLRGPQIRILVVAVALVVFALLPEVAEAGRRVP